MKKYSIIIAGAILSAFAFSSCNKEEANVNEKEVVPQPIHFYAETIETKTTFGTPEGTSYPTVWTNNKGIKISQNKAASVEATVTPKESGAKADFTPATAITDDGSGNYMFYALSPSSAQSSKINTTKKTWNINVPTEQTPLANSVDEAAQVLYAEYDAGTTFPTAVPFQFHHVTAYGKVSFTNLALDDGETISSVIMTSSATWAGKWYYYIEDNATDGTHAGDFVPNSGTTNKKLTITTDKASDVWFACAPVDLSDGGSIDFVIVTDKGTFSRKVTFPAGKGNFQAGHIASFSVNMSGIPRVTPATNIAGIKAICTDPSASVPFTANLTDALVTLVNGNNFYLEDASGAIYGFTSGHGLSAGDKLNGTIKGNITKYQGNYEITGFVNEATKTTGSEVTPTLVTADALLDSFASYESKLVKVANVTISEVNGKNLSIEGSSLIVYNNPGIILPVGSIINAVGIATYYNETKEVKIFSLAEEDKISIVSQITASDKEVEVGKTVLVGASSNSPATITYLSGNSSIATVDDSGTITGVAEGSTTITCSVAASGVYSAAEKVINITVSPAGVTDYSTTYTSNVTLSTTGGTSASTAKVVISGTQYDAIKAGTGSVQGAVKITVPTGTTKLHVHMAAWNGESVTVTVTPAANVSGDNAIALTADAGVKNNTPFTLAEDASGYYTCINLTGITDNTELTFAATTGKRFVIFGVNTE